MNPACIGPRRGRQDGADDGDAEDWPSWRLEEFMPEAMPAWDFGTPDMTP